MSKKLKVLITGGAGFIGSHLAEAFVGLGHNVRILDDDPHDRAHERRNLSSYCSPRHSHDKTRKNEQNSATRI